MSRNKALLIVLGLLLAMPAQAQEKLRIGTWNIEHLGSPENRFGDAAGIAQKPTDLAAYIKASGVHVLALQEIGDTLNPGQRSKELDATLAVLNADGQDWIHELTPNKDPNDKSQLTGVAWNRKRVNKIGTTHRFPIKANGTSGFNHWDRHPSAFKFSAGDGKTDFVVISIHLKAGASDSNKKQREEEVRSLCKQLPVFMTFFKEDDVVIIGDHNVRDGNEEALKVITAAGFTDLNKASVTTVPWGNGPFDHIFVPTNQLEFKGTTMTRMVFDNDEGRRKLSDHFLVYTDFDIQADDDPNDVPFGDGTPVVDPVTPAPGGPTPLVNILAALPDPIGPDENFESVTIANGSPASLGLQGWKLMDKANNVFNLSGAIPASATLSVTVRGNFSLNQSGDSIRLINPSGQVVHEVSYLGSQVQPGRFITFGK